MKTSLVIAHALAQLGKRYVFGASGPNSYDCSGLVVDSFKQVGVSLPHNAAMQFEATERVYAHGRRPQPADLAFFYKPIEHVVIYLGLDWRGRMMAVSATDDAHGVEWIDLHRYANPIGWGRVRG